MWQNLYTDIIDPVAVAIPKQPIGKTLHGNGGWAHSQHFTTPYNKMDLRLPKNIKSGYSVGFGADRITFTPDKASPSLGQIDPTNASAIDYQDVWVDTDVILTVRPNGIKEEIVLKSSNSPTTFSFKVDGPIAKDFTSGDLRIEAPWYEDAAGTRKDATMAQRTQGGANTFVDITVDTTGMTFPITVDPTVNLPGSQATAVYQQNPSTAYGFGSVGFSLSSSQESRSLIEFDVSSIPLGTTIKSSYLYLYNWNGTSGISLEVDQITSSWSTATTWNTQPTYTTSNSATSTSGANNTWQTWDLTAIATLWIDGTSN